VSDDFCDKPEHNQGQNVNMNGVRKEGEYSDWNYEFIKQIEDELNSEKLT